MDSSLIDLSKYRFGNAAEDLEAARTLFGDGKIRQSVNRSYYAIFHSLRAVTALDHFDSRKHSGIIAYFNRNYVKSGIFDKEISQIIDTAFRLREKADYQDFYVISVEQAQIQIERAQKVMDMLQPYLEDKWRESEE